MNPPAREEALFQAAVALAGADRTAFLDRECGGDAALRGRLEALLAAHDQPDTLFGTEAGAARPTISLDLARDLADDLVGETIGRYKLLEKIGEGGCGVVYVAEQTEPVRRRVALKIIKLGMDTKQVVARFEAERQALAMMDHPNIAKVLDAGTTDCTAGCQPAVPQTGSLRYGGRPYFVMELVRGIRITDYCDQKQLSTRDRLDLFIKVCHAIQHAHQKGIIHRDIKPSNILVTLHDGVPVPKVIDFGIAKATEGRLTDATVYTQLHQFIGTPAYMSPEQAEMSGLDIDTRSDIYSLGVLLYELLTGTTPFDAKELMSHGIDAMRRTIREQEPPRPSTRLTQALLAAEVRPRSKPGTGPSLSSPAEVSADSRRRLRVKETIALLRGDLDWIVMKCLEKDRGRRYETANGLAADLKRHLNSEPVVARPPSAAYRFRKAWRRNKVVFTAGAAVATILVLATVFSTWQTVRATRASHAAIDARSEEEKQRLAAQKERNHAQLAREEAVREGQRAEQGELHARRLLYAANMNLARLAWERGDIGQLSHLVALARDDPLKGFEWYFWKKRTHLNARTLGGHLDAVLAVAISPDGSQAATASWDHTAAVWDIASGEMSIRLRGHTAAVVVIAYSPDGRQILTGSWDRTVRIWDASSGECLRVLRGHTMGVSAAAYSLDGSRLITAGRDGTVWQWNAVTGERLVALRGHSNSVYQVRYSPDGRQVVTVGADKTVRVWEGQTGHAILTYRGHDTPAAVPDRTRVALDALFLEDGQRVLSVGRSEEGASVRVWNARTGVGLAAAEVRADDIAFVHRLLPTQQGTRLITADRHGSTTVWNPLTAERIATLSGHSHNVGACALALDGRRLITGSTDQTARVWTLDAAEPRSVQALETPVWTLAVTPDGALVAVGGGDAGGGNAAELWHLPTGRRLHRLEGHSQPIWCLAFSPNSRLLVTAGADQTVKVWDTQSGREQLTFRRHSGVVWSVAFLPDGQRVVSAGDDRAARIWDVSTGGQSAELRGHADRIWAVAVSSDGATAVTASDDRTAKVWELATGHERLSLAEPLSGVRSVATSPDGRWIATGSADDTVRLWDASTGTAIWSSTKTAIRGTGVNEMLTAIRSVAFSPGGRRLLTCSISEGIKLWDVATGQELLALHHPAPASGLVTAAFSPDERQIWAGTMDGNLLAWNAATPEEIAGWQQEEAVIETRLAALRAERTLAQDATRRINARNPGAIREWIVIAPFASRSLVDEAATLNTEQIPDEASLRPRPGDAFVLGSETRIARAARFGDSEIDFNRFLGQAPERAVAYAITHLLAERRLEGLRMHIGSDDLAKIYLNGVEVYRCEEARPFAPDQDTVDHIALQPGPNTLVFKVVNAGGRWMGSIRLTDAAGNPVEGIRATVDSKPEEGP